MGEAEVEYYSQETRSLDSTRVGDIFGDVGEGQVGGDHSQPDGQELIGLHVSGDGQDYESQAYRYQEDVTPGEVGHS